jgi:hypothetical protein
MIHIKPFKVFESSESDIKINDNFWRWFDKSKVTHNKEPLIVYHGSQSDFDEFKGYSFFTDDYMNADGYASGEYVYEVYLRMNTPLTIDCKGKKWDEIDTPYGTSTIMVIQNINRGKHDGVIFTNVKDSWIDDEDYQDPGTVYVTFSANQVKSIYNDGSWDINDNNIFS